MQYEDSRTKSHVLFDGNILGRKYVPTPILLNHSDPVRSGAGGDTSALPLLSDSFADFFPRKFTKNNQKSNKLKIRPNPFETVSDEIIVKIFSYLNRQSLGRSAAVCQRYLLFHSCHKFNVWKFKRLATPYHRLITPSQNLYLQSKRSLEYS